MPVEMPGKAMVWSCSSSATRIDSAWQLARVPASRCAAAAPDWPDGVNDVLRRQSTCGSSNGLACRKPSLARDDRLAGFENRRAPGAMDGAVHAATAHQGRVRGIHDGVAGFAGDVARTRDDEQAVGVKRKVVTGSDDARPQESAIRNVEFLKRWGRIGGADGPAPVAHFLFSPKKQGPFQRGHADRNNHFVFVS